MSEGLVVGPYVVYTVFHKKGPLVVLFHNSLKG